MYYAEKLIRGILYSKSTPTGDWHQVSIEVVCRRLVAAEKALYELQVETQGDNSGGLGAK